jgi:anti-sigma factor RsiW
MMDQHACQHLLGQLSDYVDGELEQTMREEIERHLADCQNCRVVVVFSIEPARIQLALIQDVHRDFETAHAPSLARGEGNEVASQFVNMWARDWKLT